MGVVAELGCKSVGAVVVFGYKLGEHLKGLMMGFSYYYPLTSLFSPTLTFSYKDLTYVS